MNIAIDGPAGAGKSTVAKILAKKLKYTYIDTGAMYRALTLKATRKKIDLNNEDLLLKLLKETEIQIKDFTVLLDEEDVTLDIRTPNIDKNVSITAAATKVRKHMIYLQRNMAKDTCVIMDGRDIGTVVLPKADFKFFITASIEERARRRYNELIDKGYKVNYSNIINEISKRDELDINRIVSPLKCAADAIVINTDNKSINEVVQQVLEYVSKGE
ncbi:MAG TPA: (d)CMP kinase [Thermoanaerobacterales bacterium]|nr:(d)CMP kinase [Thermoanaerobacterales bacterium]